MKKNLVVFLLIVLVAIGGFMGWQQYSKNEYTKNLKNAMALMITESWKAQEMAETYNQVWRQAIDGGVEIDGQTTDDFNHALNLQAESFKKQGKIDQVNNGKKEVDKAMQAVNNPPSDLKKAYETAFELYGTYSEMVKLANFPSGTLLEFNRKIDDLAANIDKQKSQFNVLIPIDDISNAKASNGGDNHSNPGSANTNQTEAPAKESIGVSQPTSTTTSSEPSSTDSSSNNADTDLIKDLTQFNGTWNDQTEDGAGDAITITFKDGRNATISLGSSTSGAAMFTDTGDIEVTFNEKGEANFNFTDSYSGITGKGTVTLGDKQVTVTTKLDSEPQEFSIFQGTKTFTKKR
ncbi:hypothetical protein ACTID9_28375 [Brevibacillus fluminis]|uniref:hypothetical protein n=1 Tax=Brevibacillus fluminis TaxID=511487 RepID=UPI003F8C70E9